MQELVSHRRSDRLTTLRWSVLRGQQQFHSASIQNKRNRKGSIEGRSAVKLVESSVSRSAHASGVLRLCDLLPDRLGFRLVWQEAIQQARNS